MSFLSDEFVKLTDANSNPKAFGRPLYFNNDEITAFYPREDNPEWTNVFTSDGKAYVVQEKASDIFERVK